jgi:hypothetical protein
MEQARQQADDLAVQGAYSKLTRVGDYNIHFHRLCITMGQGHRSRAPAAASIQRRIGLHLHSRTTGRQACCQRNRTSPLLPGSPASCKASHCYVVQPCSDVY